MVFTEPYYWVLCRQAGGGRGAGGAGGGRGGGGGGAGAQMIDFRFSLQCSVSHLHSISTTFMSSQPSIITFVSSSCIVCCQNENGMVKICWNILIAQVHAITFTNVEIGCKISHIRCLFFKSWKTSFCPNFTDSLLSVLTFCIQSCWLLSFTPIFILYP